MKRRDFYALRHALRAAIWSMSGSARHFDMADSRLMVQHTSEAEAIVRRRARIHAIRQELPASSDPKGFAAMARNWERRRLAVLSKLKTDAYRTGDYAKYAGAHGRYFDFYKQIMRKAA